MALLIVDAGHTHLKFSLYVTGCEPSRWAVALRPFSWPQELDHPEAVEEVLLMGTNDDLQVRLQSHMAQGGWGPVRKLGTDLGVPIELGCSREETGNDRQANALGARHAFPGKSVLVVSFGSALVMDRVSREGVLEGGLIGLGRHAYARAMAGVRSCLVPAEPGADYPGKNTAQAVALGWDEPTKELLKTHAGSVDEVIFTGGGAQAWKSTFPGAHILPWLGHDAMAKALGYWATAEAGASSQGLRQK